MAESNLTVEERQVIDDFQVTFGTPHGQRVLANLEYWSGYSGRVIPTPDDTLATLGCALGRRDIFIHILDKVNADLNKKVQTEAEVD